MTSSPKPPELRYVYASPQNQRFASRVCESCWGRHLEFKAEAEEQFRRSNPVDEVCAALRDEDVTVRREATYKLERLRDPRAVEPLFDALENEPIRDGTANTMISALEAIGGAGTGERLLELLRNQDYWIQIDGHSDNPPLTPGIDWVSEALHTLGGAELMLRGLLNVVGDQLDGAAGPGRRLARMSAARELAAIVRRSQNAGYLTTYGRGRELSASDRELLIDPLRSALHDEYGPVRASAADALGLLGAKGALDELLTLLADDERYFVRCAAAEALGNLGDEQAVEPLRQALGEDKDMHVTGAAEEALAKLGR